MGWAARGVVGNWRCRCARCVPRWRLNLWVGYFPTVQNAWKPADLGAAARPDGTPSRVTAMQEAACGIRFPPEGTVVAGSTFPTRRRVFKHRGELVYLPPAWYATDPPPPLPTVMMVGGEVQTLPPTGCGRATRSRTIRRFRRCARRQTRPGVRLRRLRAARSKTTTPECVNRQKPRQRPPNHLHQRCCAFHGFRNYPRLRPKPIQLGRSSGGRWAGTCAVDFGRVMHPDMFRRVSRTSRAIF